MNYGLNTEKPQIMWIDLNSAFATAEQQANPLLRGRPMGVTNRLSKNCCVIACSYEAKALGITVGFTLQEARELCPSFIMLETDPPKYHHLYKKLCAIMQDYSPKIKMKSIDEGIIDFHGMTGLLKGRSLEDIGREIKQRMLEDVGDYTRVNIGIGPNRFLAKTAAGLNKPDGMDIIDYNNVVEVYKSLELTDLNGIADRNEARLNAAGIRTPIEFLEASSYTLQKQVFRSINGLYWHKRLRGYEIDDNITKLGMVGRQWVVRKPTNDEELLRHWLHYLTETTAMKLRYRNVVARGVCVHLRFRAGGGWYKKQMFKSTFYTNEDIWHKVLLQFNQRPKHMVVTQIGLYLYQLTASERSQLSMFEDIAKKEWLTKAVDEINDFYGAFTVFSADTLVGKRDIKQKIPFGGTEYFDLLLKRQ